MTHSYFTCAAPRRWHPFSLFALLCLLALILPAGTALAGTCGSAGDIQLRKQVAVTAEERAWIASLPALRVGVIRNAAPLTERDAVTGAYRGISIALRRRGDHLSAARDGAAGGDSDRGEDARGGCPPAPGQSRHPVGASDPEHRRGYPDRAASYHRQSAGRGQCPAVSGQTRRAQPRVLGLSRARVRPDRLYCC